MPLFPRPLTILSQPVLGNRCKWAHNRRRRLLLTPIAGLHSVKRLADCLPRVPLFPSDHSNRFSVDAVYSSDKLVLIHPNHPFIRSFLDFLAKTQSRIGRFGWGGSLLRSHSLVWWSPFTLSKSPDPINVRLTPELSRATKWRRLE
jgi:hypothetical protein